MSGPPDFFHGKTALVTGAGVRLGRAIAQALAARGCALLLHCNRSARGAESLAAEIHKAGGRARVLRADLSKRGAALKLARAADRLFDGVDILVNSAAIFHPTPLEKLSEAEFDAFVALNTRAPYVLSAELGRRMKARAAKDPARRGAIVNIACLSGLRAWKAFVPYAISKAGVVSMTQGFAKLLAPEVRVNAVAPGTVLPPEGTAAEELEALRAKIPLRAIGSARDVADAVLYLASAPFVTGQILCVDGGRLLV
jgi:pteridine reductase